MAVSSKGLFKRKGSKKWHCIIQVNKKRYQLALHENKQIAAEMREKEKARLKRKAGDKYVKTWEAFKEKHSAYVETEFRENTRRDYRRLYGQIELYLKPRFLSDLTEEAFQDFKNMLTADARAKGVGLYGVNKSIQCYKAMLRVADGWGWLVQSPKLFVVKQHKITLPDIDFIEQEDLPVLLKYSSPKWRFSELLGTRAGPRPIEIIRLLKTDFDLKNRIGHIRPAKADPKKGILEFDPKTYECRTFKITDEMVEAYNAIPKNNSPYLVTTEYNEPFASTSAFDQGYKKHLKKVNRKIAEDWAKEGKAGEPTQFDHPPKIWRKTFGSHLIMQGVDLYAVSKLLGHKNVLVTQRHYAPLLERQFQKFVLTLPKLKY